MQYCRRRNVNVAATPIVTPMHRRLLPIPLTLINARPVGMSPLQRWPSYFNAQPNRLIQRMEYMGRARSL